MAPAGIATFSLGVFVTSHSRVIWIPRPHTTGSSGSKIHDLIQPGHLDTGSTATYIQVIWILDPGLPTTLPAPQLTAILPHAIATAQLSVMPPYYNSTAPPRAAPHWPSCHALAGSDPDPRKMDPRSTHNVARGHGYLDPLGPLADVAMCPVVICPPPSLPHRNPLAHTLIAQEVPF